MKKRLFAAILAGLMVVSMAGCGSSDKESKKDSNGKQDLVIMITNPGEVNEAVEKKADRSIG